LDNLKLITRLIKRVIDWLFSGWGIAAGQTPEEERGQISQVKVAEVKVNQLGWLIMISNFFLMFHRNILKHCL